jgi:hypothetical protein
MLAPSTAESANANYDELAIDIGARIGGIDGSNAPSRQEFACFELIGVLAPLCSPLRNMKNDANSNGPTWGATLAFACLAVACGGGPQIKTTPDYAPKACAGQRVLFVPIAVSDDLGDQRTGIVLSGDARHSATEGTCNQLAHDWDKGTLVCPPLDSATKPSSLSDLERAFALDAPVTPGLLEALRGTFHANYALLFRPENVSSSNHVDRSGPEKDSAAGKAAVVGGAAVISPAALLGSLFAAGATSERKPEASTTSRTELRYTVSATLLDLRSGKVLKVGLNQGSATQTVPRNLGYAEAPPVAPLLQKIMIPLGEQMLEN